MSRWNGASKATMLKKQYAARLHQQDASRIRNVVGHRPYTSPDFFCKCRIV